MTGTDRYRTLDVPVRGGELRLGVWEPAGADGRAPTVVAVHGVTASHRCWSMVADRLPQVRIVAPDLRGRGRSAGLPGPYGMAGHADDIAAVLDALEVPTATVVGHSMGGFVAVALRSRHRARVPAVVLVDGGLPLPPGPPGLTDDERSTALLGPAKARLTMTFPDRASYRDFFRAHPAFAGGWNDAVADYVDYDLTGAPPELRPSTPVAALTADTADLWGRWLPAALDDLPVGTTVLRAPRGLQGEEPGMYPPEWAGSVVAGRPSLTLRDVPGVNHYTILFSDRGAAAVADAVRSAVGTVSAAERGAGEPSAWDSSPAPDP
ncbi:alpha/beta hydrolase [Nakamurella deserti]|uniref:alpha/beta hydrolase n=1 Tax=Nakamurella deserti TaxID=2164074 RepID=UPI000DBE6DC9|nr:alpha/beta hydrolase [Nakamurella deserti]